MYRTLARRSLWLLFALRYLLTRRNPNVTIVTAADSSHAKSLCQLLRSVITRLPTCSIICFDLGMTNDERSQATELLAKVDYGELRLFPFDDHPPYFNIRVNAGEYAWKPVIIASVVDSRPNALVIWLDAGNLVTNNLFWVLKIATREGFFSPWSSGTIAEWTHPKMLQMFNFPSYLTLARNLNAAVVFVDGSKVESRQLIKRWRECAESQACIAPLGSSRLNHRQDQAALTLLAYQSALVRPFLHMFLGELWEPFGVRTHCDID